MNLPPKHIRGQAMIYKELGSSGIKVSAVGFGAWAIGGWMWGGTDDEKSLAAIGAALDHGVNLIDTAPAYGYGHSEELIGRAIAGRRDQVVLATKCGLIWDREEGSFFFHSDEHGVTRHPATKKFYRCLRPDSLREELDRSLARLKTDYVDLYQTHWQDPGTPLEDAAAELLRLKEQGKIRAFGVCNTTVEEMQAYGPIASDQEKYSLLDRKIEGGSVAYCLRQGIGILAYSPLANGLLTGKIRPDRKYGPGDLRRGNMRFSATGVERVNAMLRELEPLAARRGVSVAQLVIAWTFAQPGIACALCGARDAAQAIENARAGALALLPDEIDLIGRTVHA